MILKAGFVKIRRTFARLSNGSFKLDHHGRKVEFDEDFYRNIYADVRAAGADPLMHFVLFGASEGRHPNREEELRSIFDEGYYLENHPAVLDSGLQAFEHFRRIGERAGYKPHAGFGAASDNVHPSGDRTGRDDESDPSAPNSRIRFGAVAERYKSSGLPVILIVSHALGGGTLRYINELTEYFSGRAQFLILEPLQGNTWDVQENRKIVLRPAADDEDIRLIVDTFDDYNRLLEALRRCGVTRVSLQHFLYVNFDVKRLIDDLQVPFDFTAHDYFTICPFVNLTTQAGSYCGEPDIAGCNRCIAQRPNHGTSDIIWWRTSFEWVFREADRIICPSEDTASRLSRYFEGADLKIVHHDSLQLEMSRVPAVRAKVVAAGKPLRIAILGVLASHKGGNVVIDCAKLAKAQDRPIEFYVIGASQIPLPPASDASLVETGTYAEGEIGVILDEIKPHLVWFPAQWPETYSYTLSEALAAGMPVVASEIGAFSERLQRRAWTWMLNWNSTPEEIVTYFEGIRCEHFLTATAPPVSDGSICDSSNFYKDEYLDWGERDDVIDLRNSETLSIVAALQCAPNILPGVISASPDACGYIRGLLPLKELANSSELEFTLVAEDRVANYVADIFFVQRTAVVDAEQANKIVSHCHNAGMKIVYDIDDDLFSLDSSHTEYVNYQDTLAGAHRLISQADLILVSTNQLKSNLENLNDNIEVVENALDGDVWALDSVEPNISSRSELDPVRILYMGTMSHRVDFQLIEKPVRRLCEEFGNRVEFEIVGVASPHELPDWCRRVDVPPQIGQSYPAFVNWLRSENRWHIGIAPLADTKFNRAKSGIKYLDYAALGLAVVCSDIEGYRDVINSDDDGLLVQNTEEAWYSALRRLVLDDEFRRNLQENAAENLRRKYLLSSISGTRLSPLRSIAQTNGTSGLGWRGLFGGQPGSEPTRESIGKRYLSGQGLEIGALQNPLPLPDGATAKYVDRFPKEKLYEHYPELSEYNLVDVDLVDNGETLSTIPDVSQQFVIANHFLEHCENPFGALRNLTRVLRAGGVLYVAVPDRRYTFDRNRKRTPLNHLIEDYESDGSCSRRSHYLEWVRDVEPEFGQCFGSEDEMQARADMLDQMNYSIHFHVWEPDDVWEFLHYAVERLKLRASIEFFGELPEEILFVLRKQ